jgi:MFS family permease
MKFSPFVLLCTTGLFAIFSSTISKSPVLPLFTSYLGADPAKVGMVAAVSAFTGIVASIPAGILSDRLGRRRMLIFSAIVFASAPFLYLLVTNIYQLAAIRFYHGLATAIFVPVAMAIVSDLFQKERGEKIGWFSTSTLVGRFMAPLIGGTIIAVLLFNPAISYKIVYLVCGAAGAVVLFLALKIPNPAEHENRKHSWKETKGIFKTAISHKGILITSAVEAAILFAYGTFETFLPLYAIKAGISAYEIGIFLSSQVITLALTKPVMGKFSDKHGREPQIFAGAIIGAVCIGGFPMFKSFIPLLTLSILFGLSLSIVTSATSALIADLSIQENRSSAMGVLGSIMDIGHTTGPLIAGIVAAYFGFTQSFLTAAFVVIVFAFLFRISFVKEKTEADTVI